MSVCVIPGSLIGRALFRKDRGAGFECRSGILLVVEIYTPAYCHIGMQPIKFKSSLSQKVNLLLCPKGSCDGHYPTVARILGTPCRDDFCNIAELVVGRL